MYGLLDDPENLENRKMYCMYLKEKEFGAGEKKKKKNCLKIRRPLLRCAVPYTGKSRFR
jgi:hypothetical protein